MPRRSKPSNPGGPTRRQLLYGVGSVLAATGFPVRSPRLRESDRTAATQAPAADGKGISDVMTRLSTYMSEARNHPLPAKPLEQAKWHVLDTFAAMVSGIDLPPGRAAVKFARAYGGKPTAMVVADILCGPIEAALVNGVLAHADETDDSWPGGWHPGCNVVPAALAVAEQFGITVRISSRPWRSGTTSGRGSSSRPGPPSRRIGRALTASPASSAPRQPPVAPRASKPTRCAGCSITRRSRLQASLRGTGIPITSRKDSCLAACRRAVA